MANPLAHALGTQIHHQDLNDPYPHGQGTPLRKISEMSNTARCEYYLMGFVFYGKRPILYRKSFVLYSYEYETSDEYEE